MARYQNEDNHFVELAMKITRDRATLTMRVMALEQLLAQHGIDAGHIMSADKHQLVDILEGVEMDLVYYLNQTYGLNWSNTFQLWGERVICHLTINGVTRSAVGSNEDEAFLKAQKMFEGSRK